MDVSTYFRSLGYNLSWDRSLTTGQEWDEIYDEEGLIAQIDTGIPLADIIEDFTAWHEGLEGTSKSTYSVNMPHNARADLLLKRVSENQLKSWTIIHLI